jgi:RNA polymerase sigma-70 factor (ECF subfamily)
VRDLFSRNKKARGIDRALGALEDAGRLQRQVDTDGRGRPAEGLDPEGGLKRASQPPAVVSVGSEMSKPLPQDEQALLIAARSSPDAFAQLYDRFERPLLQFFMHATGRAELAADLTAETFARAIEAIANYDPARGRADQWLFGIVRNILSESYRRGRVDAAARQRLGFPRLVLDDHAVAVISRLGAAQGEATLALAELPHDQRQAIQARVLDERDYDQIADELQCSEAVVRQRVSRGLRALRTRLAGDR